ncbi:MAG: histidine phosphatase family protein [Acetobacteraceae bacterium]|jgi:phosphohistidine phosphatase SixA|nr:histidine phosphatase family protein [Acetobacteraceae bacterium]
MIQRRFVLAAFAGFALPARADASLIGALRAGGCVVYIRHAITDRSQVDTGDLTRREGQRNLSAEGRAQAQAIGRAIVRLGIPIGAVLTSPVFRARDTAELAFGTSRTRIDEVLTADDYTPDSRLLAQRIAETRRRLTLPPASGNDILVGHIVPLGMVLGRSLGQAEFAEGTLALFRPGGAAPDLMGFLHAGQLIAASG